MQLPFELPLIPQQFQVFVLGALIVSVSLALLVQIMNGLARRFKACPSCEHSMPKDTPQCPMCGTRQP